MQPSGNQDVLTHTQGPGHSYAKSLSLGVELGWTLELLASKDLLLLGFCGQPTTFPIQMFY